MPPKPETIIVTKIMKWIKAHGGDCFHVHGSLFQRAGEPDICGELPTPNGWIHLKIEVKTTTGKPSPLQEKRIKDYVERGYYAKIVYSYEECIEWLQSCGNTKEI